MKLVRFGTSGDEKPGVIDEHGKLRDLSAYMDDITAQNLSDEKLFEFSKINLNTRPIVDKSTRLGPCVSGVGKFICIGLNYADHAKEAGMEVPPEPVIFMKATSAICGPTDPILLPRGSVKTDWEVELAVVIGKKAKYVELEDAMSYVAGYAASNDISERTYQLEGSGHWTKGKSCDSFGPLGPYLVTKDEIPDPQNLSMWLSVNGQKMQDGSTSTMVYGVEFLVHYISQFMSLMPGDIISTGTPPGVGLGMKPPVYLKVGDIVTLGIEGLGEHNQTVIAE
ncbi:MAG: 2-hydroxyhepta-2,4-diene-1,7-dioate isomerase [Alphaproteobacteria bacterium]|nr:2-hydroxyhepta-2,4-diene-1,7-dioate isomerase [Alphaproteobacteria bacterium]